MLISSRTLSRFGPWWIIDNQSTLLNFAIDIYARARWPYTLERYMVTNLFFPLGVKAFDCSLIFPIPGKFLDCDDYTKLNEMKSSFVSSLMLFLRVKGPKTCDYPMNGLQACICKLVNTSLFKVTCSR